MTNRYAEGMQLTELERANAAHMMKMFPIHRGRFGDLKQVNLLLIILRFHKQWLHIPSNNYTLYINSL